MTDICINSKMFKPVWSGSQKQDNNPAYAFIDILVVCVCISFTSHQFDESICMLMHVSKQSTGACLFWCCLDSAPSQCRGQSVGAYMSG